MAEKTYLGDSVYADTDGFHIILTTENGFGPSNTIYLEKGVYNRLLNYAANLDAPAAEKVEPDNV